MILEEYMKDNGKMIREMSVDSNYLAMVTNIMASIKQVKLMAKGLIHGVMMKLTMESGEMDKSMVMVYGRAFKVIVT